MTDEERYKEFVEYVANFHQYTVDFQASLTKGDAAFYLGTLVGAAHRVLQGKNFDKTLFLKPPSE